MSYQFDTTVDINDEETPVTVTFEFDKYIPERRYLSNGDPGYEAEGGFPYDIEITGNDVTEVEIHSKQFAAIEQECFKHIESLQEGDY